MKNLSQLSQSELFHLINHVSFAVNDIQLFLNSHPTNQEALAYFHEHSELRNEALKEYSRRFGPLTIDTANENASKCWEWIQGKWPWEGGQC